MDIMKMMADLQSAQGKIQQAQDAMAQREFVGAANGGLVTAVVRGDRKVLRIEAKPELAGEDLDMVLDLAAAAVNQALDQVEAEQAQVMQSQLSGIMPNIPGLGF